MNEPQKGPRGAEPTDTAKQKPAHSNHSSNVANKQGHLLQTDTSFSTRLKNECGVAFEGLPDSLARFTVLMAACAIVEAIHDLTTRLDGISAWLKAGSPSHENWGMPGRSG